MSELGQLLLYLNKQGITQVLLQEGSPACVVTGDKVQPLSTQALTRLEIETMLQDSPLAVLVENASDTEPAEGQFDVDGRQYLAKISFAKERLRLRFSLVRSPHTATRRIVFNKDAPPPVPGGGGSSTQQIVAPPKSPPKTQRMVSPAVAGTPSTSAGPLGSGSNAPVPVVRDPAAMAAIENILTEARALKVSDVHISSGYPTQVRQAGVLKKLGTPIGHEQVRNMLLTLLNPTQQSQLDEHGYTDLSCNLPKGGRLRVNICRQRRGLKGCFRLIPSRPGTLAELGLPKELSKTVMHHQGLVVVSGPNGTGKTTTMASLVDMFNQSRPIHIITVEDPVEIIHQAKRAVISQREVGSHTKSFQAALKGALREDPDVIAIGELRDQETVEMALSAAETGHLVISTMSTPSGALTIDRLIDMFPQGVQSQVRNTLSVTLKMVISQRLVPSKDRKRQFVAVELITGSLPLCSLIRDNKLFQLPSLLQQGRAYGMIRMEESLNALLQQGRIDLETARRFADDPKSIGQGPSQEGNKAHAE